MISPLGSSPSVGNRAGRKARINGDFIGFSTDPCWSSGSCAANSTRKASAGRETTFSRTLPNPLDPEEIIYLTGGQVCAHWPKENSPAKAFFEKVFRIVARLTTDSFISVGPNLKARGAKPFRSGGYYYRAGRDACAWALQRRHNYFQDRWKPGNYPFKPDEIYTPEELAAEGARNEALWAEMKAKTEAEIEANRLRRPRAKRA